MLTKVQRLEIENQVLRQAIATIKAKLEQRKQLPLGEQFDHLELIKCLGSIDAAVDYEQSLQKELEWAEYREKEKPRQYKPGKIRKTTRVSSL